MLYFGLYTDNNNNGIEMNPVDVWTDVSYIAITVCNPLSQIERQAVDV